MEEEPHVDKQGSNGGKWRKIIWTFFCFFLILSLFVAGFMGFKLFKNGELRSPDLFQYFLDDLGNFENLVKMWTRRPPNYYQNCSKIQETLWNHPGKISFMSIWDPKKFENVRKMYVLGTICFCFVLSCSVEFWVHVLKIILWRWGLKND